MLEGNVLDVVSLLLIFGGYNPSIDHFHTHLEDLFRKIAWTTFLDPFLDFSKTHDKFIKVVTIINML